jgi:hypothetical protein
VTWSCFANGMMKMSRHDDADALQTDFAKVCTSVF